MTVNREATAEVVRKAVAEFNLCQPAGKQIPSAPETVLLGPGAVLNSTSLVALIVTVEEFLEEAFGVTGALSDEKAMSQKRSPFRTIGTLVDYIVAAGQGHDE